MARATALKRKVFADSSIIIAGTASRTGASRAVLTLNYRDQPYGYGHGF